jgi:hypothetical protein
VPPIARRHTEISASKISQPDAVSGRNFSPKSRLAYIVGAIGAGILHLREQGGNRQKVALRLNENNREAFPMTIRPDPTFHASPKLAMEAPPENFAYTLLLSPDFSKPDALAVIDGLGFVNCSDAWRARSHGRPRY